MRMFYTDPLAAAYMAREFGVDFTNVYTGTEGNLVSAYSDDGEYVGPDNLNIHPDSLDIFDLQDGDLYAGVYPMRWNNDDTVFLVGKDGSQREVKASDHTLQIIMRDNRQFFMPEQDND